MRWKFAQFSIANVLGGWELAILLFGGIPCCQVPAKIEDQSPDIFAQGCCAPKALFLPARDLLTDHGNRLQLPHLLWSLSLLCVMPLQLQCGSGVLGLAGFGEFCRKGMRGEYQSGCPDSCQFLGVGEACIGFLGVSGLGCLSDRFRVVGSSGEVVGDLWAPGTSPILMSDIELAVAAFCTR